MSQAKFSSVCFRDSACLMAEHDGAPKRLARVRRHVLWQRVLEESLVCTRLSGLFQTLVGAQREKQPSFFLCFAVFRAATQLTERLEEATD